MELKVIEGQDSPAHAQRPPVDPTTLAHRDLLEDDFWRRIPAYAGVDEATFLDHRWQMKKSITKVDKLLAALEGLVSATFLDDAAEGFARAPMAVRVSPYLLSLIDWENPYEDPLRRQFIPLGSTRLPDHPKLRFDSLAEQADSPVPGLTHRYPDKALFLALDTCPVYCRFCTRSYAVGPNVEQEELEKVSLKANKKRWDDIFAYIATRPELEDIVISGGDSFNLRADQIRELGNRLLDISNVRRMRFATKGPAVMPQKVLSDDDWFSALVEVVQRGRTMAKDVVLHTHFNHPNELTGITKRAMDRLFSAGVTVRNQSVLQRGVNDDVETMQLLVKRLGYCNVQPYYVYQHDMVKGVEELRTTVDTAISLEKNVRGVTAGFNTPVFVVDAPGGGGKRDAHSFEYYDRTTGVSVYTAPSVKSGRYFLYFDPIHLLPEAGQVRWKDEVEHNKIVQEALDKAQARAR
ncbi:MAG: KamA family radical SAM protein [Sandaracinaceae bacterium]|nr:MAG: KamA family radical SAM protein [Sandaracinaceae bacterium]HBQ10072.1 KamA family radical SAM protein [Myxococcales bacterium]